MLHRDPNQRLTMDQVRNHPYFTYNPDLGSPAVRNLIKALNADPPCTSAQIAVAMAQVLDGEVISNQ